ncbi:MAG: hypothetical protein HXY25_03640 [Alphaproteobacteria bacterium]|nr:hypothetical protein [Alphaproteobacteria bacterium]
MRTARKAAGGLAAEAGHGLGHRPGEGRAHEDEAAIAPGRPAEGFAYGGRSKRNLWTLFFLELPRPQLTERSASDLSLEKAREYVAQSETFFSNDIRLFSRGDIFYEEVEQGYLAEVLGADKGSIDTLFVTVAQDLRKALNANTRLLFLVYAPLLLVGLLTLAALLMGRGGAAMEVPRALAFTGLTDGALLRDLTIAGGVAAAGLVLLLLVTKWPYEVTQQRNLLGFDNYVSNKYARINHNFQVAKRKALNVERDKRRSELEALREEAGTWTLAYHWFAFRLLLCDLMIRNVLFQVRRNTTLYGMGGAAICLALAGGLVALAASPGWHGPLGIAADDGPPLIALAALAVVYVVVCFGLITRDAFAIVRGTLEGNQWNRFQFVNLAQSIADHVGEDKIQIVTFRDRFRTEG